MTELDEFRRDLDALYRGVQEARSEAQAALSALDALALFLPPEVARVMAARIEAAMQHTDWRYQPESEGFMRLSRLLEDLRETAGQPGTGAEAEDSAPNPPSGRVRLRLVRTTDPEPPEPTPP